MLRAAIVALLLALVAGDKIFTNQRSKVSSEEVFMRGRYIEVGMHRVGSFGTANAPGTGFNGAAGAPRSWGGGVGFIADYAKDGFGSGFPAYSGDYFLPGSPLEGWSIQFRVGSATASETNYINKGRVGAAAISPTTVSDTSTEGRLSAVWVGKAGDLKISKSTSFGVEDLFFVTSVTLKNEGSSTMFEIDYMRNVDPDQEQPWSGSYTTNNYVKYNVARSGEPDRSHPEYPNMCLVVAKGVTYPALALGLGAVHPNCRASQYGFRNDDPNRGWTDTAWTSNSESSPRRADEGMNLVFRFDRIDAGASVAFDWAYILNEADLLPALLSISAISILQPTDTASGTSVVFSAEASPITTKVEFYVNSGSTSAKVGESTTPVVDTAESRVFQITFDSTTFVTAEGYTFKAIGTSPSGSIETSKIIKIDNNGPVTDLTFTPAAVGALYFFNTGTPAQAVVNHIGGPGIARVSFFRDLNTGSTLLKTDTSAPFDVSVDVSDLSPFTPVTLKAVSVSSSGSEGVTTFSGIVAEPNLAPSDITLSASSIAENSGGGSFIGTLTTTDPNAADRFVYEVLSSTTYFDVADAALVVKAGAVLDHEAASSRSVQVRTTDSGGETFTKTFTISITNVNEPPSSISMSSTSVSEDASVSTTVGTLSASDPDSSSFTYTLTSTGGGSFFLSGTQIKVAKVLDYEAAPVITIAVTARDNGSPAAELTQNIDISLNNVNEAPTNIELSSSRIQESEPSDSVVGTFATTDPDAGQSHSYSLVSDAGGSFRIVGSVLRTTTPFNFESTPSYEITVKSTDNGSPARSRTQTFLIAVDDLAEPPGASDATLRINENSPEGALAGFIPTTATGEIELEFAMNTGLSDANADHFAIQSCSGAVFVNVAALDYETDNQYTIKVDVIGELTTTVTVTVNINDINEPPQPDDLSVSVPETERTGHVAVSSIPANDPDAGSSVSYEIIEGNFGDAFAVSDASTGRITVNTDALNFENLPVGGKFYELLMSASDGSLSSTFTLRIDITDVNEPPQVSPLTVLLDENSPIGTEAPVMLVVFDEDGDDVSFSIIAGNTNNAFRFGTPRSAGGPVDRAALEVNSDVLDFEAQAVYTLTARCEDARGEFSDVTVTVELQDVNESPSITGGAPTLDVQENSVAGRVIGSIGANYADPDADTVVTWAASDFSAGTDRRFAMDSSGVVTVLLSPNFEDLGDYSFTATVTDQGGLSASTLVTINVLDVNEPPTVPESSTPRSVDENLPADSPILMDTQERDICADDFDAGTVLTYSLDSPSGAFKVVGRAPPADGFVKDCAYITTTRPLDAEALEDTSEVLTLTACDNADPPLCGSNTLVVDINNVNEPPVVNATTIGLRRNSEIGTVVGNAQASDPEGEDATLQFELLSQTESGMFTVDSSGQIVVADHRALIELPAVFTLSIRAVETAAADPADNLSGAPSDVTIVVIDGNFPPVLTAEARYTVPEGSTLDALIGDLTFSDPDSDTQSFSFSYSPVARPATIDFDDATLVPHIRVAGPLDHETLGEFSLTVKVEDSFSPPSEARTNVVIEVTDVNERPTIDLSSIVDLSGISLLSVPENGQGDLEPGVVVGDILAVDEDDESQPFGTLTFSIAPITAGDPLPFSISKVADRRGRIELSEVSTDPNTPDFETRPAYPVRIIVEDGAGLSDSVDTTILVTDRNDPPTMNTFTFDILEDDELASVVGTVFGDDVDRPADLLYEITAGDTDSTFTLNAFTGVLTVANILDFESRRRYDLTVKASDKGRNGDTSSLSASAVVVVNIGNVNDVTVESFSGATSHKTVGGELVTIHGTNFGPKPDADTPAGEVTTVAVTYGPTGVEYTATDCSVDAGDNTAVTCTTAAGSGGDLRWRVTINGVDTAMSTATTAYRTPEIGTLNDIVAELSTQGGEDIIVFGTDFGDDASRLGVSYGSNGREYAATGCTISYQIDTDPLASPEQQLLTCQSSAGVGQNLEFAVTVQGQQSDPFGPPSSSSSSADRRRRRLAATAARYNPPTITSVSAAVDTLTTRGGDVITITGTSFGPAGNDVHNGVGATYGPVGDETRYHAINCAVSPSSPHTEMTCETAFGVGRDHVWRVSVGDQTSESSTDMTSYTVPTITAIGGQGASQAKTEGGQRITVTGTEFGAQSVASDKITVRYGRSGVEFLGQECVFAQDFTGIRCLTAPGTGKDHLWTIEVDGQVSAPFAAGTSYAAPVVSFYTGVGTVGGDLSCTAGIDCGVTSGAQDVFINGLNFGPASLGNAIDMTYGETGTELTGIDCAIVEDHVKIRCKTTEGAGKDHIWSVVIDGQQSVAPTTAYAEPEILDVTGPGANDASVYGGERVTISGANFGPPEQQDDYFESVTYGPTGVEYTATDCTVVSHLEITCVTAPGVGRNHVWIVRIEGQESEPSTVLTSYADPSIEEDNIAQATRTTDGDFSLEFRGRNFGGDVAGAIVEVFFYGNVDDAEYQTIYVPPTDIVLGGVTHIDSTTGRVVQDLDVVTFPMLPGRGQGRQLRLTVRRAGTAQTTVRRSAPLGFDYAEPTIIRLQVKEVFPGVDEPELLALQVSPFFPLMDVVVIGTNFGASAVSSGVQGATVETELIPSDFSDPFNFTVPMLTSSVNTWDHERIHFVVPHRGSVKIVVSSTGTDGTDYVQATAEQSFDFDAPSVSQRVGEDGLPIFPEVNSDGSTWVRIEGRFLWAPGVDTNVTIGGDNFGVPIPAEHIRRGSIVPEAGAVVVAGADDQYVEVKVPVWQGPEIALVVFKVFANGNAPGSAPYYVDVKNPSVDRAISSSGVTTIAQPTPDLLNPRWVTARTDGTSRVRFEGYNFGINFTRIDFTVGVVFGSALAEFTDCVRNHTFIECTAPAGEGTMFPETTNPLAVHVVQPRQICDTDEIDPTWDTCSIIHGPKFIKASLGDPGELDSEEWHFRYEQPLVTMSQAPLLSSGGVVTLKGINFGITSVPTITLEPVLDGIVAEPTPARTAKVCTPHGAVATDPSTGLDMFMCDLPEGVGARWTFNVEVAGQSLLHDNATFAYAPPQLLSSDVTTGSTAGGYLVTLTGTSFGSSSDALDIYVDYPGQMYQASRYTGYEPALVDPDRLPALGSTRVPDIDVVSHSHTEITFRMPAGQGHKAIHVIVGHQLSNPLAFEYDMPVITSLSPLELPTTGSTVTPSGVLDVLTLNGQSFGVASTIIVEFSYPVTTFTYYPDANVQNEADPIGAPVTQTRRLASRNCTMVPPGAELAAQTCAVLSYTHDEVEVMAPEGVGETVNVRVIVEYTDVVFDGAGFDTITTTVSSNVEVFDHAAPQISEVVPNVADARGGRIDIFGDNFGELEFQDDTSNVATRQFPYVHFDGIPCYPVDGGLVTTSLEPDRPAVRCDMPELLVGRKNVTLSVAFQTTQVDFTNSKVLTQCRTGYHGRVGEYCEPCPPGTSCAGGEAEPVALPGFYLVNYTGRAGCSERHTLRDECREALPCEPNEACLGANQCALGYQDPIEKYGRTLWEAMCSADLSTCKRYSRCSTCSDGYYRRSGECVECPKQVWLMIVAFIVAAVFVCIVGYYLNKKAINIAFLSIGVDYFQVLAMFSRSKVSWPTGLQTVFEYMGALNFNIEITAPECAIPDVGYKAKWAFIESLPIFTAGIFLVLYFVQYFKKRCIMGRKNKLHSHLPILIGTLFVMMYYLYLNLTRTVLDVFNCQPTEPSDGKQYLEVVFEECGIAGGIQLTLLPWAILAFIVYVVGYPVLLAAILYKKRNLIMEDQLLRAQDKGGNRTENPNAYTVRKMYHKVYYHFKPDYYFWSCVILARKFGIAFTSLMFNRNPAFQMSVALLVLFLSYAAQVRVQPYMSKSEQAEVMRDHDLKVRMGDPRHSMLAAQLKAVSQHNRRLATNTGWDRQKSKALNKTAAINFFWSYNTVESTLLMSAILINLAGVMFESGRFDSDAYQSQKDIITWLVAIVIVFSIIYYIAVLVSEVWLMCAASSKRPTKTKTKPGDKPKMLRRMSAVAGTEAFNPMFAKTGGGGGTSATTVEAILVETTPPNPGQWAAIRTAYAESQGRIDSLVAENTRLKRAQQGDLGRARATRRAPSKRQEFQQRMPRANSVRDRSPAAPNTPSDAV